MSNVLHLSINGTRRVTAAEVVIPEIGVWVADVDLDTAEPVTGSVTLTLGSLSLRGTVDPVDSVSFVETRHLTIRGGGGGWGKELPPKPYHNDAGVKRSTVLEDAARAAGETLVVGAAVEARVGVDYCRHRGAASLVFEHVAPGLPWWVGADGVTQIATARPSAELAQGADIELLDQPSPGTAVLAGDPGAVAIGTVLRDTRLDAPFTVRELVVVASSDEVRLYAYDRGGRGGRLAQAVRDLVEGIVAQTLPGLYRYRVVAMSGDRVQLQAVAKGRHPNILPASLGAGVAGGWASLAGGAEVLVAFEEGSPTRPLVVGYTPRGRPGHVPEVAALDGDVVELGDAEAFVHRIGDAGSAGSITAPPGTGTIVWALADGSTQTISIVCAAPAAPAVITIAPGVAGFTVPTIAVGGSGKVMA